MQLVLTRHEVSKVLDALDLMIDAEWMRPERRPELEDLKAKIEEQVPEPPPHGTYARYVNRHDPCRCDACRRAHNDYMRGYRAQDRARKQTHLPARALEMADSTETLPRDWDY
jgi:hypothetical protein